MNERLRHLAALKGIACSYHDIWGREHTTPDESLCALLVAMGALEGPDASPTQLEAAIAAHETAQRAELLPPVLVRYDDEPGWTLPAAAAKGGPLEWRIDAEDGSVRRGRAEDGVPAPMCPPQGYHTLTLWRGDEAIARCMLIVAPRRAFQPPALHGRKAWGVAAQLYGVRSARNWGIGDYTDLAGLVDLWGRQGAAVIGVSPLHAMFPHNPAHASPYSPSSRLFFNVQYLDVEAIADYAECAEARAFVDTDATRARLGELRDAELVDHVGVAQLKRTVLEMLYAHFRRQHLGPATDRAQAFEAFRRGRGAALRRHALFEALQEHFHRDDAAHWGWPAWPAAYRDPASPQVGDFERRHIEAVEFYEYLQWQADLQIDAAQRRSRERSLAVGLYIDLAVSIDRAGAEAWSEQALYALGASVGAPPDDFNLEGQNWGLPPIDPTKLRAAAYAPFIATLQANMAHAGALRIDHVMALMRLFWIPPDAPAYQGAYVHYPFDELLAIVALESHRNGCLIIGEDLGTVPDEVRTRLAAAGVLSYRVLLFERDEAGEFRRPGTYPPQSMAVASTHDLPTLAGWWSGRDIELRAQLGLYPSAETHRQQLAERAQDRARLLAALEREQLFAPGALDEAQATLPLDAAMARALHLYLARSPALLVTVQLEDVLLARDAVNLPGTTDEVPNWRRKLAMPLEQWANDERVLELASALSRERPVASPAPACRRSSPGRAIVPRATYRVQLHREFGFMRVAELVPYLAALGVSHVYCSPLLRARPGSMHGYDVVDHGAINPELGTRAEFDHLVDTLRRHDMGLLIDIVPNHMGVLSGDNAWWLDVLESGEASAYGEYFDIDWRSADPALTGRVLLPILGDQYGIELERGAITLGFDAERGSFTLSYYEHRLPIDPAGYGSLLRRALGHLPPRSDHPAAAIGRLAGSFDGLPSRSRPEVATRQLRQREKTALKARLAQCVREHPALGPALAAAVASINGRRGARTSFDALDALIDAQAYRLAHWRVAADEINYRRFFDINDLAALRMERAEVFEATHRLVLELAAGGAIDGLRVDHPDGLADPAGYFRRLQIRYAELAGLHEPTTSAAISPTDLPLYVVAEKIAAHHEQMPRDWLIHGTTGYRFANVVNGLLVDPKAKFPLEKTWHLFVGGEPQDFDALAWQCRHAAMAGTLAGELTVLATEALRLAREDRRTRDFTLNSLRRALAEVVASFPVYRTYVIDRPSAQDRRFIDWAIGRARRRSLAADASVFDFLRRVLLGRPLPGAPARQADRYRAFTRRFQQYTSPVAAKGIEDTALYRHLRLISLNDVGGDPDTFGMSVAAFHAASMDRSIHWPHTMLATSTHDGKRSEDVRARIDVISETPTAWRLTVRRWRRMNRSHKRMVGGARAPSRDDEYLLYQTLVGSLPPGAPDEQALARYTGRIEQATLKAARESKLATSWINPNGAYEAALSSFVRTLLEPREGNLFLADLRENAAVFAWYGALNGVTMATLKALSPGVPDFYQGHESIELSLVDPDNRRPVDFAFRSALMADARAIAARPEWGEALRGLLADVADGRAKFWATWRCLQLRREHEAMLREAEYVPLEVRGERAQHVVAYARRGAGGCVIVIGTRLFASLAAPGQPPVGAVWGDTAVLLPRTRGPQQDPLPAWIDDAVSGRRHAPDHGALALADVLRDFPVAALYAPLEPATPDRDRGGQGT